MLAVAASGILFGILRLPEAWILGFGLLAAIGSGLAMLIVAMALGGFGFGLIALADRLLTWVNHPAPKPGAVDEWWS
jgi:hypothetical protein